MEINRENTSEWDYRALLVAELGQRHQRNAHYSLRAFARDIKLSPAFLSELLNHKRSLTERRSYVLTEALNWETTRKELFHALVRREQARTPKIKKELENQILKLRKTPAIFRNLKPFELPYLGEWYHDAILELSFLKGFQLEPRWISKRLKLSLQQATDAISELKLVGMIVERKGKWVKATDNLYIPDSPVPQMRYAHEQLMNRAKKALRSHPYETRKFRGMTMAIDPKKIPEANQKMSVFLRELMEFLESGERTAVYHLSTAIFRLDEGDSNAT